MTEHIGAVAALPVEVSTDPPKGLTCLPVWAYTPATLPADVSIDGNPVAQPVYVVSLAEIEAGTFALQGNPAPLVMCAGTGRPVNGDAAPIAVYIVGGSF